MSRRPSAPEVWEQALINSRRVLPNDPAKALQWAEEWYLKQGQRFIGEPEAAPEEPQADSASATETEPETPVTEAPAAEPACPMPTTTESTHEEPKADEPKPAPVSRRRSSGSSRRRNADPSDS